MRDDIAAAVAYLITQIKTDDLYEAVIGVLLSLTRAGLRLVTDLREGSHSMLRRWMSSLSPEDLAALTRGWRALAEVASRHGALLENSAV